MRLLALDSSSVTCAAAVFNEDCLVTQAVETMDRGQAARFPALVAEVLAAAGGGAIGLVAATVGPGSFTGLRGCLALAHGLAAGWGCPIVGVGVAEVLVRHIGPSAHPVWVVLHSRTGRVFLARDGVVESFALDALPAATGAPVLTGNAAGLAAERLRQRDEAFTLRDGAPPSLAGIAAMGLLRHRGVLPPMAAQPLYVDAPEAKLPPPP